MKQNKFSIIVPHLNEGYYLDIMLDAFYNYIKYDNYEIIICDDGSDDLTHLDFIKNHFLKDKITLYKNNKLGLSANKNFGASKANGNILIFLDSHMYFNENFLDKINNIFNCNSDIDILQPIVGSILNKNIKGEIYKLNNKLLNSTWDKKNSNLSFFETSNVIGCAMIVKQDCFNKLGGFNRLFKKWGVEDVEFSMRAWLSGFKCYLSKDILINHYFKESFKNTVINNEDVLFNKIIFTLTCFQNPERQKSILKRLSEYYGKIFLDIYLEITKSEEIQNFIKGQQELFFYDDDWYFEKFKEYYKEF